MSSLADLVTFGLVVAGAAFFVAGTVGLLRFPDVYTRLHALTKADNLGLGLIVLGLMPQATDWRTVLQLLAVWLLTLLSTTTVARLVATAARERGLKPWHRP